MRLHRLLLRHGFLAGFQRLAADFLYVRHEDISHITAGFGRFSADCSFLIFPYLQPIDCILLSSLSDFQQMGIHRPHDTYAARFSATGRLLQPVLAGRRLSRGFSADCRYFQLKAAGRTALLPVTLISHTSALRHTFAAAMRFLHAALRHRRFSEPKMRPAATAADSRQIFAASHYNVSLLLPLRFSRDEPIIALTDYRLPFSFDISSISRHVSIAIADIRLHYAAAYIFTGYKDAFRRRSR